LYLNAEPTSDWTIPDVVSFEPGFDGSPEVSLHDPLSQTALMDFLSDFRTGHLELALGPEVGDAEVAPHIPAAHQPAGSYLVAATQEATYLDDPYLGSAEQVAGDWWLASDGRWYPPELHPDLQMEAAWQPEDAATFDDPDYPGEDDGQPDPNGGKARRTRLRGRRKAPATV
jgi:hypothetical protein